MHPVDRAACDHRICVEKPAPILRRDLPQRIRQPRRCGITPGKLRPDWAPRVIQRRRRHHQDFRYRNLRLQRGRPNRINDRRDPHCRMPGRVSVNRLEIIRPQHDNHHIQWGLGLNHLLNPNQTAAARLIGILERGSPTIEALLRHMHPIVPAAPRPYR